MMSQNVQLQNLWLGVLSILGGKEKPQHTSVTGSDFEDDDDQIMSSIDYCYKVSAFPQNYKEAVESSEYEHWSSRLN